VKFWGDNTQNENKSLIEIEKKKAKMI